MTKKSREHRIITAHRRRVKIMFVDTGLWLIYNDFKALDIENTADKSKFRIQGKI